LIVNCVFDPEPVVSAQIGKSIAEKLSSLKHHVTVIAPRPSRPFGFQFELETKQVTDFELKHLDSYIHPQSGIIGRFRESISFGIASYKYICANAAQIDLVYMNTWPIFSQLAVALASKKIAKPYKIHIQDIYPESITNKLSGLTGYMALKMLMPIEKYVLRNADKILVISDKMKQYLSKSRNLQESKFEVILNWQDDSVFHEYQNSWCSGPRTFMYLGNIGPVAGIPFVIEAFAKAALSNSQLIIAGVGSSKDVCINMAENYPEAIIQFIEVPEGKVPIVQSQAHVMILPLTKEAGNTSIPSKLPAYMFSARPVIALAERGTDVEKTILESGGGWIGDPENEVWLVNCFKQVSKMSDEMLIQKGKSAQQYAALYFAKENNLNKLIKSILY
jgi:glycosyltransferase involved in cell wall biosynthesis